MQVRTEPILSEYWEDFNAADFGAVIDLDRNGDLPTSIVLKEAGALYCTRPNDEDGTMLALPAGYVHTGRTATILAAQTATLVVYW